MTEEIKFEKALERLEKIVEDLETGNVTLEEALKRYEEGVRLSQACQRKLNQAEKKIEILTRSLNGVLKKEPFEYEGGGEEADNVKSARKKMRKGSVDSQKGPTDEEDLLL